MRVLEVWTGSTWSAVKVRADGQPVYVSNNALVGTGMRITRVSDVAAQNNPPIAQDIQVTGSING